MKCFRYAFTFILFIFPLLHLFEINLHLLNVNEMYYFNQNLVYSIKKIFIIYNNIYF